LSLTKPAAVIIEILEVSIFIISTISIPQLAMPLCFHVFPDSLQTEEGLASVIAVEADKITLHLKVG